MGLNPELGLDFPPYILQVNDEIIEASLHLVLGVLSRVTLHPWFISLENNVLTVVILSISNVMSALSMIVTLVPFLLDYT